jgi:2-dehydro-3-deoxyphosphogluconate aldolase/(4S)-4-hydroxy-2-oxoglutarate aldolase
MIQNNIRAILSKHPLIPVVTFHSVDEVNPILENLLSKNIHCIEITLRTPIAFDAIQHAITQYGDKVDVGIGTIINKEQIQKAKELNVQFMVSPGLNPAIFDALENSKIAFIPGVATPSEIMVGLSQGWDTFKFFPANLFGGKDAIKAYGQLFPDVKFCPTGGINKDTFQEYLDMRNVISVGGSWMTS